MLWVFGVFFFFIIELFLTVFTLLTANIRKKFDLSEAKYP